MKMITLVSLLTVASFATAETTMTNTVNNAVNTVNQTAQTTTNTIVKKAKKATTSQNENTTLKGSVKITSSVTAEAAKIQTTKMPAANIIAAAAAGTSVSAIPEVKNETKNWNLMANENIQTYATETEDYQFLTTIGGSYNISNSSKAFAYGTFASYKLGRALENNQEAKDRTDKGNFRPAFGDIGFSAALPTMLGSDMSSLTLKYRNTDGDAIISTLTDYAGIHGFFQANYVMPYTMTTNFNIAVDTAIRHSMMKDEANRNRLSMIPTFTYAFNDTVKIYQQAGYMLRMVDNNQFRRQHESAYIQTGIGIAPIKNLDIDLNVNQEKAFYSNSNVTNSEVTNFSLYKSGTASAGKDTWDFTIYEANVSYGF